jgi:ABC-type phosphate transport system substrate-binding protein
MRAAFRHAVLLLVFAIVGSVASQAKQLAVVVDKSNKLDGISSTELAKILSLDTRRWQDGRSVLVILSDSNANDVKQILQRALKLPEDKVRALLASHKDSFLVVNSDEELLKRVASMPGAIGLVDVYSITSAVSVVKVDNKLPLEVGYPLR